MKAWLVVVVIGLLLAGCGPNTGAFLVGFGNALSGSPTQAQDSFRYNPMSNQWERTHPGDQLNYNAVEGYWQYQPKGYQWMYNPMEGRWE